MARMYKKCYFDNKRETDINENKDGIREKASNEDTDTEFLFA